MKPAVFLPLLAGMATAGPCKSTGIPKYPTTTIAGIEVVDTQLVRDAVALINNSGLHDYVVKHQIRSWLYGAQELNNNASLKAIIDPEAQAITCLLHDLGWDMSPNSPWTTKENRFEVDSANGARNFVRSHPEGKKWSEAKVQQMWDAITLQGAYSIAAHKEPLVWGSIRGVAVDYEGAGAFGINQTIIDQVTAVFPDDDLLVGTNDTFKWFCESKPATTYDTWMEPWGTLFVDGYNATGHRMVDRFTYK